MAASPQLVAARTVQLALAGAPSPGAAVAAAAATALRVGVDGAVPGDRAVFADAVAQAAADVAAPVLRVSGEEFLLPRSVRLEHGADDGDAAYERWYDHQALRREVLDPLGPGGSGCWLPSLWDPVRDRATRAAVRPALPGSVLVVEAPFLLRWELVGALDVVVHVQTSPAARARRLPPEALTRVQGAWTRYLDETDPAPRADVLVRCEDPAHPALVVADP